MIASWARAFALTQIIEIPIYRFGLRAAFGASAITHPIVCLVAVESGWSASWIVRTVTVEVFPIVVETIWFGRAARTAMVECGQRH